MMPWPVSVTRRCTVVAHPPDPDLDAPAPRRELDGVDEQVPEHLLQAVGIAEDDGGARIAPQLEARCPWPPPPRARSRRRPPRPSARSTSRAADLDLAGDDAGVVQQVGDEPRLRLDPTVDGGQPAGQRGGVALSPAAGRMCIQPTMAVSGPRSSCETVATNSSLSWSAASARSRAACSRTSSASRPCSTRLTSVRSSMARRMPLAPAAARGAAGGR